MCLPRLLQFRLRTLFMLVMGAAIIFAWLRPYHVESASTDDFGFEFTASYSVRRGLFGGEVACGQQVRTYPSGHVLSWTQWSGVPDPNSGSARTHEYVSADGRLTDERGWRFEMLIDLITRTVEPESWRLVADGSDGDIVSPGRMRTVKLIIAYDGTDFAGWQVQEGKRTVQGVLEEAWAKITGEAVRATASGRTDAGVHALAQVVSLRTDTHLVAEVLQRALNASLPDDLVVLSVEEVPTGFHAIRDAVGKRYRYVIHDGPLANVFRRHYSWKVWYRLDEQAMHRAAQALVGTHDFRSFQTSGAPRKTTVRTVSELTLRRGTGDEADLITCEIEADGFLYNMVRAIVGTLHEVGRGSQSEARPREVLEAHDRRAGGMTAPPQGLFLVHVRYAASRGGEAPAEPSSSPQ